MLILINQYDLRDIAPLICFLGNHQMMIIEFCFDYLGPREVLNVSLTCKKYQNLAQQMSWERAKLKLHKLARDSCTNPTLFHLACAFEKECSICGAPFRGAFHREWAIFAHQDCFKKLIVSLPILKGKYGSNIAFWLTKYKVPYIQSGMTGRVDLRYYCISHSAIPLKYCAQGNFGSNWLKVYKDDVAAEIEKCKKRKLQEIQEIQKRREEQERAYKKRKEEEERVNKKKKEDEKQEFLDNGPSNFPLWAKLDVIKIAKYADGTFSKPKADFLTLDGCDEFISLRVSGIISSLIGIVEVKEESAIKPNASFLAEVMDLTKIARAKEIRDTRLANDKNETRECLLCTQNNAMNCAWFMCGLCCPRTGMFCRRHNKRGKHIVRCYRTRSRLLACGLPDLTRGRDKQSSKIICNQASS